MKGKRDEKKYLGDDDDDFLAILLDVDKKLPLGLEITK